jgi:hypothetical protein
MRLDLMLDIFQSGGPANLARGTNPGDPADVVVPGRCPCGSTLDQMRPAPPAGVIAIADFPQLTTTAGNANTTIGEKHGRKD